MTEQNPTGCKTAFSLTSLLRFLFSFPLSLRSLSFHNKSAIGFKKYIHTYTNRDRHIGKKDGRKRGRDKGGREGGNR